MNKRKERNIKMVLYEMVEQGELVAECDCEDCDPRLFVTSDFE